MDVYVRLSDEAVAYTVEQPDELGGVIMDYAEDGTVVGIEVLDALRVDVDDRAEDSPGPAGADDGG